MGGRLDRDVVRAVDAGRAPVPVAAVERVFVQDTLTQVVDDAERLDGEGKGGQREARHPCPVLVVRRTIVASNVESVRPPERW